MQNSSCSNENESNNPICLRGTCRKRPCSTCGKCPRCNCACNGPIKSRVYKIKKPDESKAKEVELKQIVSNRVAVKEKSKKRIRESVETLAFEDKRSKKEILARGTVDGKPFNPLIVSDDIKDILLALGSEEKNHFPSKKRRETDGNAANFSESEWSSMVQTVYTMLIRSCQIMYPANYNELLRTVGSKLNLRYTNKKAEKVLEACTIVASKAKKNSTEKRVARAILAGSFGRVTVQEFDKMARNTHGRSKKDFKILSEGKPLPKVKHSRKYNSDEIISQIDDAFEEV